MTRGQTAALGGALILVGILLWDAPRVRAGAWRAARGIAESAAWHCWCLATIAHHHYAETMMDAARGGTQ